MKIVIVFLLRVAFMLFSIPVLLITGSIEYMSADPDWEFWRSFNKTLIDRLPWASYT